MKKRLPEDKPLKISLDWSDVRKRFVAEFETNVKSIELKGEGRTPEQALENLLQCARADGAVPSWFEQGERRSGRAA